MIEGEQNYTDSFLDLLGGRYYRKKFEFMFKNGSEINIRFSCCCCKALAKNTFRQISVQVGEGAIATPWVTTSPKTLEALFVI